MALTGLVFDGAIGQAHHELHAACVTQGPALPGWPPTQKLRLILELAGKPPLPKKLHLNLVNGEAESDVGHALHAQSEHASIMTCDNHDMRQS